MLTKRGRRVFKWYQQVNIEIQVVSASKHRNLFSLFQKGGMKNGTIFQKFKWYHISRYVLNRGSIFKSSNFWWALIKGEHFQNFLVSILLHLNIWIFKINTYFLLFILKSFTLILYMSYIYTFQIWYMYIYFTKAYLVYFYA